ncbi:Pth11-like integral membrane protein [Paramyrothecium foliicola]|nr:Pth11-like integral membrane protein [Paramyrothecium foliicola]
MKNPFRRKHIESRVALANLCRVSSLFRSLATSYLYRNILLETLEQLASFFYSITSNDANRLLVQTFAWYNKYRLGSVLYRNVTVRPTDSMDKKVTAWPRSSTDKNISRMMGLANTGTAPGWRILGALLGMLPEVRVLSYALRTSKIVGSRSSYQCPEEEALMTLLGGSASRIFLQNLQTVILGPGRRQSRKWVRAYLFNSLVSLLHNSSSSLRHIEVSHLARQQSQDPAHRGGVEIVQSHLKAFSLLDVSFPSNTVEWAVSAFPTLTQLVIECKQDSRYGPGLPHLPLSDFRAFKDLHRLSATLETLSLTSVRHRTWVNRKRYDNSRRGPTRVTFRIPPLLPDLRQMACLKYLTTESIWIFGINDRVVDPCLVKFLPASLESLRLLDFWGVSDGFPYYPDTLESWNGLWFYDQAFSELHDSCLTQCPELRDITTALLPDIATHNTVVAQVVPPKFDNYGRAVPRNMRSFTSKYQALFAEIGVGFTNITPDEFTTEIRAEWAPDALSRAVSSRLVLASPSTNPLSRPRIQQPPDEAGKIHATTRRRPAHAASMTDSQPALQGVARIGRQGLGALLWVCFTLATLFVAMRLALRWRQNRRLLADDYWIVLAWTTYLIMANLMVLQLEPLWFVLHTYPRRLNVPDEETPPQVRRLIRLLLPMLSMFWTVIWSVKASFMALFYPLVKRFRVQRPMWYGIAVFAALAYMGCWISSILSCESSAHFFTSQCTCLRVLIKQAYSVIYSTIADVLTDLMIMALPLTVLPALQLDMRGKIGLAVVFCLGLIIIATAIARMTQVLSIAHERNGVDVDCVSLFIWTIVEATVALIVGSLPPLKGLLVRGVKKHLNHQKVSGKAALLQSRSTSDSYASSGPFWPIGTIQSMPLEDLQRNSQALGQVMMYRTIETRVEEVCVDRRPVLPGSYEASVPNVYRVHNSW